MTPPSLPQDPRHRGLHIDDDTPVAPPLTPVLAEGEAIALPPTDDTPNQAPPDAPTRIPHLGHALIFLALTGFLLLLFQAVLLTHGGHTRAHALDLVQQHPKLLIFAEVLTYLGALGLAFPIFRLLWQRPFLTGLQFNAPAARRNLFRLVPLGLVLSLIVQAASNFVSVPKKIPMDSFFHSQSDIWLITVFGIVLAPLFEEVLFRGFLLPAFAIAYDWLSLPRTPAAREAWHASNLISQPAFVFSAVLTSVLFALLHGQQTAFTWPILGLLFCVSLALTFVRVRLRSVAASTVVHATYNATVFLAAFIATGGYRHLDRLPT